MSENALQAYLSGPQQVTLRALLDRLIPPDDWPGAVENGVEQYLARQFARDLAAQLPLYQAGLDSLEAEAQARHDAPFYALDDEQQDAIIEEAEGGVTHSRWSVPPRRFVALAVHHAAEGYYADPGNGANQDEASWRMIGFLDR